MKTFLKVLLCCLLFAAIGPAPAPAAGDRLILATIPSHGEDFLKNRYTPLVEYLSRSLGRPVELEIANSYEEIGERVHHKAADLGILGPKSYVEARDKHPDLIYMATCKLPEGFYHSLIITRRDNGIDSLAALKDKTFGFVETGSTSGYLYPRQMLKASGIDPDTFFARTEFLNKHDKVYTAVAKGVIDAGAVSSTGMKDAVTRHGEVFRVLGTSEPIPTNAVIAGAHLPPQLRAAIREVLRNTEHDPTFMASGSSLKGFLIRDDSLYDIVRREREQQ